MKTYIKRGVIGLLIVLFIGGGVFLVSNLVAYKIQTKTPEVKKSIDEIVEGNKENLDKVYVDNSKITSAEDIYNLIHQMANTIIVAEDNLIYGEIPINDESINKAMVMINNTDLISKEEKEVFMNILEAWQQKDYSNGVQAHNYAWKLLDGNIGRAKSLRSQYKK